MRLLAPALALVAALAAMPTDALETDPFWSVICVSPLAHPISPAAFQAAAATIKLANCGAQPALFQDLPSTGGAGDASVALNVGFNASAKELCFVNNTFTAAPVIRVGAGHTLTFGLTNTLQDTGSPHTTNCAIATFGGEGLCVPTKSYAETPGPDIVGSTIYYPIEANQATLADGTTNLHTHGLFVTPQPCSDEVLRSAIYPANWNAAVTLEGSCQTTPYTLTYTYNLPSDHPAGAYWYHTHRHGQAEQQTQMGLVGAIIVQDGGDAHRASLGVTDEVLVVTDTPIKTCVNGPTCDLARTRAQTTVRTAQQVTQAGVAPAIAVVPGSATPLGSVKLDPRIDEIDQAGGCATGATDARGGYQLWTINLNGAPVLDAPDGAWPADNLLLAKTMQPGQRQIFRLINASADSFIAPQLVLKSNGVETPQPLEVFAFDGVGLANAAGVRHITDFNIAKTPIIVPPAGRVEFVVHAPAIGQTLYLDSNQVNPGCGGNLYPPRRMLRITSAGAAVSPGAANDSDLLVGAAKLPSYIPLPTATPSVKRTFVLTEYGRSFTYGLTKWTHGAPPAGAYDPNQVDFYITQVQASDGSVTPGKTALIPFNMASLTPQVTVHLHGQNSVTEEWTIENATLEIHAFHIHQVHFRDITSGSTNPDLTPVLDTDTVPAAQLVGNYASGYPGAPGVIKLLLTFTQQDVGEFVFHCHILEHEDNGMMAKISVVAD